MKDNNFLPHKQVPSSVLKRFNAESGKRIPIYLDLETCEIKRKRVRELGAQENYYTYDGDKIWNAYAETDIGRLNKKVARALEDGQPERLLDDRASETVKKYVQNLFARSDDLLKKGREHAIYSQFALTEDEINTAIAKYALHAIVNSDFPATREHDLLLYIASEDARFVVPSYGVSPEELWEKESFVIPVSPKFAYVLTPPENNRKKVFELSKEEVTNLNIGTLIFEYLNNKSFVACNREKELIVLKNFLYAHREALDAKRISVRAPKNNL